MHKRIVRKDGSVVLLVPRADSKSVTWEILYKVGSRQESASINGASHFIEHLFFKGTKRRPTTLALSRTLDSVGAVYNAFTGKDHTGYYVTADSTHTQLGIDFLSDMLHNSKFDPKEIDRERGVIIEELNMYRDNPLMRIDELFEGLIFNGMKLGMEIGGPRKVIASVPREKLIAYRDRWYYPGNSVIGVAGGFNEEEALKLIDTYFPIQKKKQRARVTRESIQQTRPRILIERRDTEQTQLILGFPGLRRKHPDGNALLILTVILGGTMSSRLFTQIRERRGLAYDIRTSTEMYEDVGYFSVHAGLDTSRVIPALTAIKSELTKVAKSGITSSELKMAKDNIRGRLTLKFERPNAYLTFLMSQELLTDRVHTLEKRLAAIDSVSMDDVLRVAQKVIQWKKSNLAVIGPYDSESEFMKVLAS